MKKAATIKWMVIIAVSIFVTGCKKNHTQFFEDEHAEKLSVFSDKGYNVMTCYVNDIPFRTTDRITNGTVFNGMTREVQLVKEMYNTDSDTLFITWYGDGRSGFSSISLVMPVQKDFSISDFYGFNGKRMAINGVNGYFIANNYREEKGTGNIYFHSAIINRYDTLGTSSKLSGLFEAILPSYKITKGRFDHSLPTQVISIP